MAAASASSSEKCAKLAASTGTSPSPVPASKPRSCIICRTRKVRCDKQSPCSNCRRANTTCVFPSTKRPPRWARRFEGPNGNAITWDTSRPQDADLDLDRVLKRLHNVEDMVKELTLQLEQARAATSSLGGGSSVSNSPDRSTQDHDTGQPRQTLPERHSTGVQEQSGRLVVQDASRIRYVSSSFWSRINDELDTLKTDTCGLDGKESDSSADDASARTRFTNASIERTPSERHAFLFRHNLSTSSPYLRDLHPLPSQIPFLLEIFLENVNVLLRIVHMPTITQTVRDLRDGSMARLTSSNEALMFSIYYAAIASMEEDEVMTNFASSKTDLCSRYRLGLEHALAKADFLNNPDLVLVQAFGLFLCLVRRDDSPRFVWMMTGLLVRMAQYLGLQRDGSRFAHLSPFEIEMRRRTWWTVCMLDARAAQDQGTDLTITSGSFDTRIPLNINDADIHVESKQTPIERHGVTDSTFPRIIAEMTNIQIQMTAGINDGVEGLEDQHRRLNQIYENLQLQYLQYSTQSADTVYWIAVAVARITMGKMMLLTFLPVLSPSPDTYLSDELRCKLFISAMEIAEYNHELNAKQTCRQWRWAYQTYTHWYAIVYLLIEVSQRSWSCLVERAWVALHSSWLIPAQTHVDKNSRIWIPLRKLMEKVRKHRDAELDRLRADPQAAAKIEMEDRKLPYPSSSGPFPDGSSADLFCERWRRLAGLSNTFETGTMASGSPPALPAESPLNLNYINQSEAAPSSTRNSSNLSSRKGFGPIHFGISEQQVDETLEKGKFSMNDRDPVTSLDTSNDLLPGQTDGSSYETFLSVPSAKEWLDVRNVGSEFASWPLGDTGPSIESLPDLDMDFLDADMDLDVEVNWSSWLEFAKGLEQDTRSGSL